MEPTRSANARLEPGSYAFRYHLKAFEDADPGSIPLAFDLSVLDRYRGQPDVTMYRTRIAGRLSVRGRFKLDFGLFDEGRILHVAAGELLRALPREEREHWVAHLVAPPMNDRYFRVRLGHGACVDEGDIVPL